ncbi:MAG: EAL domain-containing protein [Mariprofundaceae bacterium]
MNRPANVLRKEAVKLTMYGSVIALVAIMIATFSASYFSLGNISLESLVYIQKTNAALWVLDVMPFVAIFLGRYVGSVLVEEAGTIIIDKTHEMWDQTKKLREQIEQENKYDSLTQLPNTNQFLQTIDQAIQKFSRISSESGTFIQTLSGYITRDHAAPNNIAVILLDIDNFKEINSTLGSHNGDKLLKEIGFRLKSSFMDSKMTVYRVGGDDFSLLKEGGSESDVIQVVDQIRGIFDESFNLNGISIVLEISVGVSIYPQHGDTGNELLQHAEIAMYSCKEKARNYTFYNPTLNVHNLDDLVLKTEIRRAFDNNELCLHYQPKVNSQNHVNEVEALVRWMHPEKGLIPPDKFIPMIVKKRLNGELLERILTLALTQAKEWENDNISLRIALNLTAFDLLEPDLPEMIDEKLREYHLKTDVLKLEITETTLVENQELTLQTLTTFAKMGIPTSIDDFGTGYSSLAYLSGLPINEIKIDRSFVTGMMDNHRNGKIIQAIIALAHSLSLYTVAEGVEDADTMGHLKNLNCDFIQGYHISRPLEGPALTSWLKIWNNNNQLPLAMSHGKDNKVTKIR